jgi:hypothetical protein
MPKPIIGNDGWPVEPELPRDPLFTEAEEEARRAWLATLEGRWRAGDTTAIARAVRELLVHQPPPLPEEWWCLVEAVEQLVDQRMPDDEKRVRREFDNHRHRWEAVDELYRRRFELLGHGDDRGRSLEKCYEAVSEKIGENYETVKSSHQLIRAAGGERATLESYKRKRARTAKARANKNT